MKWWTISNPFAFCHLCHLFPLWLFSYSLFYLQTSSVWFLWVLILDWFWHWPEDCIFLLILWHWNEYFICTCTPCTHLLSSLLRKDFISLAEECHGEQCGIIQRINLAGLSNDLRYYILAILIGIFFYFLLHYCIYDWF